MRNPEFLPVPGKGGQLMHWRPKSDQALAWAAAHESEIALDDLYRRHNQRVYSVCLGMTKNISDAEDLTQEVFVHLLHKIGSFRGDSKFSTWLYRLTVNLVLMHFRRQEVRGSKVTVSLEAKTPGDKKRRRSSGGYMAERIDLDHAMGQLPTGCRAVFELFDIEGYRHDEIADILGCTVGTSKSQLHKARKRLRQLLSQA